MRSDGLGLSTVRAIRVCICPASATGRSGVMLIVASPTFSPAAQHSTTALSNERVAKVQIVDDGRNGLTAGIPGILRVILDGTANLFMVRDCPR